AGPSPEEKQQLLLKLAERRSKLGDVDGEVRALTRALREGMDPAEISTRIVGLTGDTLGGDGEIAWLEARARLLSGRGEHGPAGRAWREVGAAVWDLASDKARALRAWVKAAKLAPSRGYMTLGLDLARFGDGGYALDVLDDLAATEPDAVRSGTIAAEASRVALSLGQPGRAFDLARRALVRSPSLGEAIEIAERGAAETGRVGEMSAL